MLLWSNQFTPLCLCFPFLPLSALSIKIVNRGYLMPCVCTLPNNKEPCTWLWLLSSTVIQVNNNCSPIIMDRPITGLLLTENGRNLVCVWLPWPSSEWFDGRCSCIPMSFIWVYNENARVLNKCLWVWYSGLIDIMVLVGLLLYFSPRASWLHS